VLAGLSQPGQHVTARKGHIGYYSGRAVVAFPRVTTLGELADYCRKHDVGWIYYSWYEALLRPEFRYLLDAEAAVPGLSVAFATQRQPGRLFRIGAGFGADPTWWGDENQRRVHVARGAVQVLDDRFAWAHHLILAQDAAARHDARSVLEHADAAIRGRPEEARAWAMRGVALHAMGRLAEARQAYETALRLKPGLPMAEQGLQKLP
jgi:tetratricopeptide (TPR) repeat protein